MPRLNSLVTVLLVLTVAIGNGTYTFPAGAFLARLHQLQARNASKRQAGSTGSNGSGISVSDFPTQCQSGCTPAVNAFNTCSSVSCLCTTSVDNSLRDCITCSINAEPGDSSIVSDGENVFSTYNTLCAGSGVKTLSLSGVSSVPPSTSGASSTIEGSQASFTPPMAVGPTTTITGEDPGTTTDGLGGTTTTHEVAGIGTSTGLGATKITSLPNAAMVAVVPDVRVECITMGLVVAFATALFM